MPVAVLRPESPAAGYLWDESLLENGGLEILADHREEEGENEYGGEVTRVITTQVRESGDYRISVVQKRPWEPNDAIAKLAVGFDLRGKEEGLPRCARTTLAAA